MIVLVRTVLSKPTYDSPLVYPRVKIPFSAFAFWWTRSSSTGTGSLQFSAEQTLGFARGKAEFRDPASEVALIGLRLATDLVQ